MKDKQDAPRKLSDFNLLPQLYSWQKQFTTLTCAIVNDKDSYIWSTAMITLKEDKCMLQLQL